MSDLGLLHYSLGLEVKQRIDGIFVSQQKYVIDILKRFKMLGCKTSSTPMNVNELLKGEDGTCKANVKHIRSIVGGLNYLSNIRPDIAHSVSVISRFMHNPFVHHLGAAKRILHYIAGTSEYGILYSRVQNFRLHDFTDGDYVGSLDDRKSTSGQVFFLGSRAVSWSSKKQDTMDLSSLEAEYIAATSPACQAIWFRKIFDDCCNISPL